MLWKLSLNEMCLEYIESFFKLKYDSDSQPGVRVPLGVRKQFAGGTPKF